MRRCRRFPGRGPHAGSPPATGALGVPRGPSAWRAPGLPRARRALRYFAKSRDRAEGSFQLTPAAPGFSASSRCDSGVEPTRSQSTVSWRRSPAGNAASRSGIGVDAPELASRPGRAPQPPPELLAQSVRCATHHFKSRRVRPRIRHRSGSRMAVVLVTGRRAAHRGSSHGIQAGRSLGMRASSDARPRVISPSCSMPVRARRQRGAPGARRRPADLLPTDFGCERERVGREQDLLRARTRASGGSSRARSRGYTNEGLRGESAYPFGLPSSAAVCSARGPAAVDEHGVGLPQCRIVEDGLEQRSGCRDVP